MTGRADTLCLLRANAFGDSERRQVARLKPVFGDRLIVAADESRGPVDTGDVPKLGVRPRTLRRLGLRRGWRWGWRCGDYVLAAARAAHPDIRHFWLVEPDVALTHADLPETFRTWDARDDDLIGGRFGRRPPGWVWRPRLEPHVDTPVHGVSFPFLRSSAAAIDAAHALRRHLDTRFPPSGDGSWRDWPNDESVLATACAAAGLSVARLEHLVPEDPGLSHFRVKRRLKFRRSWVENLRIETVVHPVYEDGEFLARIARDIARGRITPAVARERFAEQVTPAEMDELLRAAVP